MKRATSGTLSENNLKQKLKSKKKINSVSMSNINCQNNKTHGTNKNDLKTEPHKRRRMYSEATRQ